MKADSQTKRAFWHDYRSPGRYLITLSKNPIIAPFSTIEGDINLPVSTPGSSHTRWTPTGRIIADLIYHLNTIHPSLKAEQYVVMPDHVHILIYVQSRLPEPLGLYVARFKVAVNKAAGENHIFNDGFNDQIVSNKRNLNTIFNYLRTNPYRLAVRRAFPDFFARVNSLDIGGVGYQAYGNLHLLQNPFKEQVVVHRADSPVDFQAKRDRWLYTAANGGVLVSPFISKVEKGVRAEAEAIGGRFIIVTSAAFPERYKPAARDFELCAYGRMLIISLGLPPDRPLSRGLCLCMNSLARTIAEDGPGGKAVGEIS